MSNEVTPVKVYLKDGLYIPMKYVEDVHMDRVEKRYERHIYLKEATCEKCEYFGDRPSDICEGCPNYKGLFRLHKTVPFKGRECLRLPYGDRAGVKKIFGDDLKVVDLTPEIPMKRKFQLTVPLKPDQVPAVKKMLKVRSGVLKSPPRSGKTVMAAAVIAKMGLKTIVLASQQDWLDNFMETFVGSDSQPAMTNASRKRVGMAKKLEDFERYDVCLTTYQTFLSPKGKKLLKKIRSMFSVLVLDEVQFSAALEFSRVLGTFNARYKFGLSGTPERKDCAIGSTLVSTPFGPIRLDQLRVGDTVKTPLGDKNILAKHSKKPTKLLRVVYEGGYVECTPDHELLTQRGWVSAKDLKDTDELLEESNEFLLRERVPVLWENNHGLSVFDQHPVVETEFDSTLCLGFVL